jgi:uncharacterized protein Yka (UPF0111/DUF47 family)
MSMDEFKTLLSRFTPKQLLVIGSILLTAVGGPVYYGITLFNDLNSTIEEVKKMSNVETRITVLEKRADTTDNRLIEMMMSNNRAVEKANDALGKAIEANGIAKSAERVTNDNVVNVKQDMKELKKALTNPLGN